jgi:cystathionine beta-lyase/cystathionine gamma-synthase
MSGFGGMVCIDLGGRLRARGAALRSSAGDQARGEPRGVESIVSLPVLTSQWGHSDEQLRAAGVTQGMLRLSIGLEDVGDLLADLDQALD